MMLCIYKICQGSKLYIVATYVAKTITYNYTLEYPYKPESLELIQVCI